MGLVLGSPPPIRDVEDAMAAAFERVFAMRLVEDPDTWTDAPTAEEVAHAR